MRLCKATNNSELLENVTFNNFQVHWWHLVGYSNFRACKCTASFRAPIFEKWQQTANFLRWTIVKNY